MLWPRRSRPSTPPSGKSNRLTKIFGNTFAGFTFGIQMGYTWKRTAGLTSNVALSDSAHGQPMPQEWGEIPPLPEVGLPESYYAKRVKDADRSGKHHAREAYKVGQFITLGLNRRLEWEKKLRYFRHALRSHCQPPPLPSEKLWMFYGQLADLVRQHAGAEALRLASQ